MQADKFFTEHIHLNSNFLAGIVSIDIVAHSQLRGGRQQLIETKAALKSVVEAQVLNEKAACLPWRGDGGEVVFDVSDNCDEMVIFADRIRHLISFFNRTRGEFNQLPHQQDIIVRIVCHCGELFNKGSAAELGGDALNDIAKNGKSIECPAYVVVSGDVHRRLSDTLQSRFIPHIQQSAFGQTYLLDGVALTAIQCDDVASNRLRDWITAKLAYGKYNQLLYFAYTNERLRDFLSFELRGVDIRILVRNWIVERIEEQEFNESILARDSSKEKEMIRRPWLKSKIIKARAKELIENEHLQARGQSVNMRFYDGPPVFKGAILVSSNDESCGRIGLCNWVESHSEGGSPYKLEEWPALILDGRDISQCKYLNYIRNRFEELWTKGLTYDEVCDRERSYEDTQPSVISKVWALDGNPYLVVYPHRRVPQRSFPVVAHEDAMAIREVEALLKTYNVKSKLLSIQLPDQLTGEWFPSTAAQEIDEWQGHIAYICCRSLPPSLNAYLRERGFPYEFYNIGTSTPFLRDLNARNDIQSPTDWNPPEQRDYSVVAKLRREGMDRFAFIVAGIRAMGTWGAAAYLTKGRNIRLLGNMVGDQQFAAVVESSFDQQTFEIIDSKLLITPKVF